MSVVKRFIPCSNNNNYNNNNNVFFLYGNQRLNKLHYINMHVYVFHAVTTKTKAESHRHRDKLLFENHGQQAGP